MTGRKRLSDILPNNADRERLEKAWAAAKAADDYKPIPTGMYRCAVIGGGLFNASTGTPGYELTLEVLDGQYAGRRVWHKMWLTEAAIDWSKSKLKKLQLDELEKLHRPPPEGTVVEAKVRLKRNDNGIEYNDVRGFDVVAVEPPVPDPYAPTEDQTSPDATSCDSGGFDCKDGVQKDLPGMTRGRGAYDET